MGRFGDDSWENKGRDIYFLGGMKMRQKRNMNIYIWLSGVKEK